MYSTIERFSADPAELKQQVRQYLEFSGKFHEKFTKSLDKSGNLCYNMHKELQKLSTYSGRCLRQGDDFPLKNQVCNWAWRGQYPQGPAHVCTRVFDLFKPFFVPSSKSGTWEKQKETYR